MLKQRRFANISLALQQMAHQILKEGNSPYHPVLLITVLNYFTHLK